MYRGRLWTMRQYAGFASAHESNARYLMLLERGQTGLSVAFDLPTQLGLDSDDPRAEGEAVITAGIDGLVRQTRSIERAVEALGLNAIAFEGSDSLDNPDAIFQ